MIRAALFAAGILAATAGFAEEEPATYRSDDYRAPVPDTLAGATVISSEAAYALWKTGRVAFIDVLPRPPKPEGLPEGTIWNENPRMSIPGSIWLPNVGYGDLADVMHGYFHTGIAKATGGDADHPMVFFCLDECWMSWNAAKRAVEYGHGTVFWYPEGTDGWTHAGYPIEELHPEPGGK